MLAHSPRQPKALFAVKSSDPSHLPYSCLCACLAALAVQVREGLLPAVLPAGAYGSVRTRLAHPVTRPGSRRRQGPAPHHTAPHSTTPLPRLHTCSKLLNRQPPPCIIPAVPQAAAARHGMTFGPLAMFTNGHETAGNPRRASSQNEPTRACQRRGKSSCQGIESPVDTSTHSTPHITQPLPPRPRSGFALPPPSTPSWPAASLPLHHARTPTPTAQPL